MALKLNLNRLGAQIAGLLCVGFLVMSSGCSALSFPTSQTAVAPISKENSRGAYIVQMSGGFSRSTTYQGELDGPVTVQTALQRSGAIEKFRSMDIMVYRVVEDSGRGLKMPVVYTPRKKSVLPEQDYALHPGDRVVIQSRTNNALDKLVDSLNPTDDY